LVYSNSTKNPGVSSTSHQHIVVPSCAYSTSIGLGTHSIPIIVVASIGNPGGIAEDELLELLWLEDDELELDDLELLELELDDLLELLDELELLLDDELELLELLRDEDELLELDDELELLLDEDSIVTSSIIVLIHELELLELELLLELDDELDFKVISLTTQIPVQSLLSHALERIICLTISVSLSKV